MKPPSLDRKQLRQALIAKREALGADERRELTQRIHHHLAALLAHLSPQIVGFCWPYRGEVDVLPFMHDWLAGAPGRQAALPVVPDGAGPLSFRRWCPGDVMVADRFGIPQPSQGAMLEPELLLIPLNGFDARGYRIGYGGGFFDRTLAALDKAPVTVGVAFELARLADVQPAAHDRPVRWLVTETGYVAALTETL